MRLGSLRWRHSFKRSLKSCHYFRCCEILDICTVGFPKCGHSFGKTSSATRLVTVPIDGILCIVRPEFSPAHRSASDPFARQPLKLNCQQHPLQRSQSAASKVPCRSREALRVVWGVEEHEQLQIAALSGRGNTPVPSGADFQKFAVFSFNIQICIILEFYIETPSVDRGGRVYRYSVSPPLSGIPAG